MLFVAHFKSKGGRVIMRYHSAINVLITTCVLNKLEQSSEVLKKNKADPSTPVGIRADLRARTINHRKVK